mmetsp:Transcript_32594/g.77848  ORF Transcript_32594/g.77848 Transcript_32594/m.77848 type:complete len:174 (-) Transcript_32594:187-708(-)
MVARFFAAIPKRSWATAAVAGGALGTVVMNDSRPRQAFSHCQVPCGIFDDEARFKALFEDVRTIEKAQTQFKNLAAANDAQSLQQAIRWVNTKEQHAGQVIKQMAEYMLAQRIKPPADAKGPKQEQYVSLLLSVHNVIRMAVMCKQNAEPLHATNLQAALEECWKKFDKYANH